MERDDTKVDYENGDDLEMSVEEACENTTVYIDGFIKPFSVEDVKAHVSAGAAPINLEEHFFMNRGNTYCYVTYKSQGDAKKAMEYMKKTRFPPQYGGYLHCRVTSVSAESMQPKRPAPLKRSEPSEKREAPMNNKNDTIVTLEDLFRKTSAKPCIYYKPLTDKEIEQKKKTKRYNVCNKHD